MWVVGTGTRGFGAKKTTHKVFCNKLRGYESVYCPKHALMEQEKTDNSAMFPIRMKQARERKKARLEELRNKPPSCD